MKSEEEIKKQLEDTYEHRLKLRVERKMKQMCRNCKHGIEKEFDLGCFGSISKWECKDGKNCGDYCGFECKYTLKDIEDEMYADISDPAKCGAKEPKIAMLIWVLRDSKGVKNEEVTEAPAEPVEEAKEEESSSGRPSFFEKLMKKIFE